LATLLAWNPTSSNTGDYARKTARTPSSASKKRRRAPARTTCWCARRLGR
jgi:hypothetical protein